MLNFINSLSHLDYSIVAGLIKVYKSIDVDVRIEIHHQFTLKLLFFIMLIKNFD